MAYYDFQNGQNQERLQGQIGNLRARHDAADADRNAAAWQRHAQKLEARLRELSADLQSTMDRESALRVQNQVHRETMLTVQAELKRAQPNHPLADQKAVGAACRGEIDRRLGEQGLVIDRSLPDRDVIRRK